MASWGQQALIHAKSYLRGQVEQLLDGLRHAVGRSPAT
jgi:hypothetical protein